MFIALFNVINKQNLLHKLFALSIFQSSVIFLYISFSFMQNSAAPLIDMALIDLDREILYANPLPQVLMLTAIVVGLATFAVGLAILIRINHAKY